MEPGAHAGSGRSRCYLALGLQLLGPPASGFKETPALHIGIEHFQGSAASVDLVVMGEIGKPFENAEQVLVPQAAEDLYIGDAALRAERSEPRPLIAALRGRLHGKAAERAHQMKRLALTGPAPDPDRT